jgi:hypothetical protein
MKMCWKMIILAAGLAVLFTSAFASRARAEKIGVLVLGAGMNETYKPDWIVGYMDHFYQSFIPGLLTGGSLEGGSCYTLIHYANEAESAICSRVRGGPVPEGTPIDIFCNEYKNTEQYPVRSMFDEPLFGQAGYLNTCYPNIIPYFIATGHSTIDPVTGTVIVGPHVSDPDGPGIGIADFIEMYAFYYMTYHYEFSANDYRCPYRLQYLRYVYGNDIPALYGYEPEAQELSNIKDEVEKALGSETTVVYRMGWEAYMRNRDIYGADASIADSTETALRELIEDEQVDRIVVLGTGGHYSNVTNWGYCWRDSAGHGVSSIADTTVYECINDLADGCGPDTDTTLVQRLSAKPWNQLIATYPDIHDITQQLKPGLQITFANAFGDYPAFNQSVVEMLKYTVSKYDIDNTASLKVILATHGYGPGYLNGNECDSYFRQAKDFAQRVVASVQAYLQGNRPGRSEVAHGENEFGEPSGEDSAADKPDRDNPLGKIMSTGEHIDIAINGTYVNGLGQAVDNGEDNFDYVIVIPILWDAENVDTLTDFRELTLGNHELLSAGGSKAWIRQEHDSDGTPYHIAQDFDSDYFTVKVMDGSGWESAPKRTGMKKPAPVKKGSAEMPTTVILTGALLSQGNGAVRSNFVAAAAAGILEAIADPSVGGYQDETCQRRALGMVIDFEARPLFGTVLVSWSTVGDSLVGDFTLYRASTGDGPYQKLDGSGISATTKSSSETEFRYIDHPPDPGGTWYYRLERSLDGGTAATYGPVSTSP